MNRTVSFYTLGCRLNQAETASLKNSFEAGGYQLADANEPADIAIINTCTVTDNGDADTRRLVNRINRINPDTRIALIGCQAQVQKEKLAELQNVCLVVGNECKMSLFDILQETELSEETQVITPTIRRESFTMPTAKVDRSRTRANLKIQDGCDFFCSFCEIPYARGRARSRVFKDILLDANTLVSSGHKELVLTGINVGLYNHEGKTILDVLDELDKIDGLLRIRISSIEPTTIPSELIKKMGRTKLCRYLHAPIQSGSGKILKAMNRKHTAKEYSNFIINAHSNVPELCIGTDVIVGFPGETDEDFQETYELLSSLPFTYFHVFSYSKRTCAISKNLSDEVPIQKIQKRSKCLRELSKKKRHIYMEQLIGKTENVLFEQKKGNYWSGLTDNYVRVKLESNENLQNKMLPVCIEKIEGQITLGVRHG